LEVWFHALGGGWAGQPLGSGRPGQQRMRVSTGWLSAVGCATRCASAAHASAGRVCLASLTKIAAGAVAALQLYL
jgi:hypothetical protein